LDYLVLHGGSCRNPWVRGLLKENLAAAGTLFGNIRVIETPDLDTSVAKGAALACYWKQCRNEVIIPPITSEEIGILTLNDKPVRLLAERERLPFPATGLHTVTEEFYVPQAGLRQLLVPFYTGGRQKLSGVVPVELPPGVPKGCPIRIKFKVDRNKTFEWWYSVGNGEPKPAQGLEDPWTARELDRDSRRVLAIRLRMHSSLTENCSVTTDMEVEEILALYNAGDHDDAELLAMELISRSGLNFQIANALSLIYGVRHEREKELHYAEEAVRLAPENAILVGNLGCTLADMGRNEPAIASLRKAISINTHLTYVYEKLGDILRAQGDEQAARREFEEAVHVLEKKNPDEPSTIYALQRLLHKLGDYDKARALQSRLVEVGLNERFQGDHRHRIAGPDSGF
jgi:Flp pilus assembly protein TadD